MELVKKLKRNEFSVSEYAKHKNEIVAKILKAGFKWGGVSYWPPSTTGRSSLILMSDNMNTSKGQALSEITLGTINSSSCGFSSCVLDAHNLQSPSGASGDLHHQFTGISMPKEIDKSI